MNRILLLLILCIFSGLGCSKYGSVNLQYPTAPQAYFPSNVKRFALINRSIPRDEKGAVIEAVFSGEVAGSDRMASDEALKGVFDRINGWHEIQPVIPAVTRLEGTGTRQTPEILDWNLVQQICDSSGADVLLVLENFDSNSDLIATVVNDGINALVNGTTMNAPRTIRVNVRCYWRLYDPRERRIVDQFQSSSYMEFNAGNSIAPIPPPDALPRTAYFAGQQYIERFLPGYYTVRRKMYEKGKGPDNARFRTGFRRAEVADWEGAIEIWKQLADNGNQKCAGRACLNIAVGYEVLGDIPQALKWAERGYVDYRDKLSREYRNKLQTRLNIEQQ